MNRAASLVALSAALAASSANAQTVFDAVNKFSWSENCGWMNWTDAGAQGARIHATFCSGYIWCENIGWISLGDGTPASGPNYSNASGADFGVNLNPVSGALSGFAWGENVGWINFSGAANPARLDPQAGRLRGYAWGENIGWINLDDAAHFVGLSCYANCDQSTATPILNVNDFVCFLNRFSAGEPWSNCDSSTIAPVLNVNDFTCFMNRYAAGCS